MRLKYLTYLCLVLFLQPFSVLTAQKTDTLRQIINSDADADRKLEAYRVLLQGKLRTRQPFFDELKTYRQLANETDADRHTGWAAYFESQVTPARDTAFALLRQVIESEDDIEDPLLLGTVHQAVGFIHYAGGNSDSTVHYMLRALEALGDDEPLFSIKVRVNLGKIYGGQSKYYLSLQSLTDAERILDSISGPPLYYMNVYAAIAQSFYNSEKYDQAITYNRKTERLALKLKDTGWLGTVYTDISNAHYNQDHIDSAIQYAQKAQYAFSRTGNIEKAAVVLSNLSQIYIDRKAYDTALTYAHQAMHLLRQTGDFRKLAKMYKNMAGFYRDREVYDSTEYYTFKALPYLRKFEELELTEEAFANYAEALFERGRYQEAYTYLDSATDFRDSVRKLDRERALLDLQTRYQTEKKEADLQRQIARNERQRFLIALVGGGAVLLVLAAAVLLRSRLTQRKHNKQLSDKNARIERQYNDLQEANEEIKQRNEEINAQKEELEATLENLRRTQARLIESEKMASLGNLTRGIAHEINTPAGIGITTASFADDQTEAIAAKLAGGHIKRSDLSAYVGQMRESNRLLLNNLNRIATLVEDLKQVAAGSEADEQQTRASLKALVEDALTYHEAFRNSGHKLIVNGDTERDIYAVSFVTVIKKLFDNVLDHAYPNGRTGTVTIDISDTEIRFADDGTGIPEDALPHIFEPFYTTNRNTGRNVGLGLHLVYNLVTQKLGGRITADSQAGEGTVFSIRFPEK